MSEGRNYEIQLVAEFHALSKWELLLYRIPL